MSLGSRVGTGNIARVATAIAFGGVKRIAKAAEIVVLIMAFVYVGMCLIILVFNFTDIPVLFSLIIGSAIGMDAAFGGGVGSAIAWGVQQCGL